MSRDVCDELPTPKPEDLALAAQALNANIDALWAKYQAHLATEGDIPRDEDCGTLLALTKNRDGLAEIIPEMGSDMIDRVSGYLEHAQDCVRLAEAAHARLLIAASHALVSDQT